MPSFDVVKRMQIQFTEEQARRLKRVAAERGVSASELVRTCVDAHVSSEDSLAARCVRASRLLGALSDPEGASDVAEEHDRYLDAIYDP